MDLLVKIILYFLVSTDVDLSFHSTSRLNI